MAHHHLLPFLALILLTLPSSFHAQVAPQTSALFSDSNSYLPGGQSLSDGDLTLSLSNDCGLILYQADKSIKDFNTNTATSGCFLSLNHFGQLVLRPSDEQAQTQVIGEKFDKGDYAMLFVDGTLAVFGPSIWNNGVPAPAHKQESAKAAITNNFLVSPNRVFGSRNGDVAIAQNGVVSAFITDHCTLAVKDDAGSVIFETSPQTDEPKDCFLVLADIGEMLLQYHENSQLHTQWTGGSLNSRNLFVAVLRYYGRISLYGLRMKLTDMVVVPDTIRMVTA